MKLPKLPLAARQFIAHVAIVFGVAFGTQMLASLTPDFRISALLALLSSSAAAGLTAVVHYLLGLVPNTTPSVDARGRTIAYALVVPPAVTARALQVVVSIVAMFLSIFGAALVAGALHVTSLPSAADVVVAAISAAVAGVVQFAVGLIPTPRK